MRLKKQNLVFLLLVFLTISGVVVLYYIQTPVLERFETHTYDLRFKALRGAIKPHPDIAIIAINDRSIAEFGRFPWTRKHYVDLIDNVKAAGAKALLMDAFFPEPEDLVSDQAFADALARAGNVVLAIAYDFNTDGSIKGKTASIPLIGEAAMAEGHINFHPDEDGVNRRSMLVMDDRGKMCFSLALRGAMAGLGVDTIEQKPFEVIVGDRHIPTNRYRTMLINYTGPPGSYPIYSFADVANGKVAPEELEGKILFMGMTALGIYDMRVTPFHGNTPGVEINATIADNIISGRFIMRSGIEALIDLFFIVAIGIVVFFMTTRVSPKLTFPTFLLVAVSYLWFANFMFEQGHWLSMIYPMTSALCCYVASTAFHFMTLDRRSREIRSVFSSYVSRKIVDQLVSDPTSAKIGGESREVTVMFLDVRGFTTFSEELEPAQVVAVLNSYLAALTKVIMEHGGTVDKFLGDGIMAYWGAPLAQEGHAEAVVKCTLAMLKVSTRLAEKYRKVKQQPLSFRVGINSGEVIAGNIGLKGKKMEYTVIGDNVNLAARLEGTAKYYGVDVLVSEGTFLQTREKFLYRELDCIRVFGKKRAVRVYELIAMKDGPESGMIEERISDFARGLSAYQNRQWEEALSIFSGICRQFPDDKTAAIYCQRSRDFIKKPPPADWDGIYERKDK
jgi:adenylate cyclase